MFAVPDLGVGRVQGYSSRRKCGTPPLRCANQPRRIVYTGDKALDGAGEGPVLVHSLVPVPAPVWNA